LINQPSYFPSCIYQAFEEQEHETIAFVPADSPIKQECMTLQELIRYPLIVRGGSFCVKQLKARGFKLKLALQCHAPEAAKTAVHRGLGVGLLFKAWTKSEIEKGEFRAIDVPELRNITFKSFIVYGAQKPLSPRAQAFIRTCIKSQQVDVGPSAQAAFK
jgi:DNA-binding transcriptional LysR family regulator